MGTLYFPMQIWCVFPPSIVECQPFKQKEFNLSHSPLSYFLVDDHYFSFLPSWLSGWNHSPWVISSPVRVFVWPFLSSSYLDRCFGSSEVYYPVTRNILLDLQVPYSYPILGNSNLLPLTFPQRIRFTSPQVVHPWYVHPNRWWIFFLWVYPWYVHLNRWRIFSLWFST